MKTPLLSQVTDFTELTKRKTSINRLFRQAQAVIRLEALLNPLLPELLRGKFKVANIQSDALVLITESAALATRFRFSQGEILAILAKTPGFQRIKQIRVKIRPNRHFRPRQKKALHISRENAQLLVEEAGHTQDDNLRKVLLKLASHAN